MGNYHPLNFVEYCGELPPIVAEKPEFTLPSSESRCLIGKSSKKKHLSFSWVLALHKYLRRIRGNHKHRKCHLRRK